MERFLLFEKSPLECKFQFSRAPMDQNSSNSILNFSNSDSKILQFLASKFNFWLQNLFFFFFFFRFLWYERYQCTSTKSYKRNWHKQLGKSAFVISFRIEYTYTMKGHFLSWWGFLLSFFSSKKYWKLNQKWNIKNQIDKD